MHTAYFFRSCHNDPYLCRRVYLSGIPLCRLAYHGCIQAGRYTGKMLFAGLVRRSFFIGGIRHRLRVEHFTFKKGEDLL